MTAEKLPPWARMSLGYDDDPLVVALGRFGEDAGLSRDMHLASIRYCRRGGTDGWLPPQEITRLAWPLPYDRALVIVEHLAEVGLIEADGYDMAGAMAGAMASGKRAPSAALADAMAAGMANGWRVPNYDKWQETAAEVEAYSKGQAERGRLGAEKRWRRGKARTPADGHRHGGRHSERMAGAIGEDGERIAGAIAPPLTNDGEPMADREREINQAAHIQAPPTGPEPSAGPYARTREAAPDEVPW